MVKRQQNSKTTLQRSERITLIVSAVVMGAFIVVVAVASGASLSLYTVPHMLVLIAIWYVMSGKVRASTARQFVIFLGVIGVMSAVFLTMAYLPYYISYLESMN
jgi:hypothetical protein